MSNLGRNNSKLPRLSRFTQQIRPNLQSKSSFGQIDGPIRSRSRSRAATQARLFEPRKQRGRGGSRFSIAAPGYNGLELPQNLANGPLVIHVWFWAFAMSFAFIVLLFVLT